MNNLAVGIVTGTVILFIIIWIIWNRNREYTIRIQKFEEEDSEDESECIPKSQYIQVGILKNMDLDAEKLALPLYARKKQDRQRWQYYAVYGKYYLPVSFNNKDCQHLMGCEFIKTGDEVTIPEYANKVFKALIKKEFTC